MVGILSWVDCRQLCFAVWLCAISFGFVVLVGIKCSICLICFICLGVVVGWVYEFVVLVILGACYCYRVLVVYLDLEVCCVVWF